MLANVQPMPATTPCVIDGVNAFFKCCQQWQLQKIGYAGHSGFRNENDSDLRILSRH